MNPMKTPEARALWAHGLEDSSNAHRRRDIGTPVHARRRLALGFILNSALGPTPTVVNSIPQPLEQQRVRSPSHQRQCAPVTDVTRECRWGFQQQICQADPTQQQPNHSERLQRLFYHNADQERPHRPNPAADTEPLEHDLEYFHQRLHPVEPKRTQHQQRQQTRCREIQRDQHPQFQHNEQQNHPSERSKRHVPCDCQSTNQQNQSLDQGRPIHTRKRSDRHAPSSLALQERQHEGSHEHHLHERYPANEHPPDPCIQHAAFPTNIQHNIQQSAQPDRIQRGENSPQDPRRVSRDRVRRVGDSQLQLHGIETQEPLHYPRSCDQKHEQREYQQQNQHPHEPRQDQLPPHPQRDQQQNQDPDQPSSPAHLHLHPHPQQQSQQQQQPPQRPTKKKKKPKPPMSYEEKRKARKCTVVDCQNYTINKGRCFRHGGGKQCTMDGCQASAKVAGLCWKHGGSVPCVIDGCERRGKSRGLCWAHGGGSKCQAHACSKVAVSNRFCWAHGGGKRCVFDGCRRPGYERTFNFCTRHYELLQGGEHTVEV